MIVCEGAYHGNSDLVLKLSTDSYPPEDRPDWLAVAEAPDTYRGPFRAGEEGRKDADLGARYAASVAEAVDDLAARNYQPAAMLVDTSWDANGVLIAPDDYLSRAASIVRSAGGLVISDEVQAGYCRLGDSWWGHERYDVVPDIVTLGKPMGGGHPVAAVVATPEIAAAFAEAQRLLQHLWRKPRLRRRGAGRHRRDRRRGPARECPAGRSTPRAWPRSARTGSRDHRQRAGFRPVLGHRSRQRPRRVGGRSTGRTRNTSSPRSVERES